MEGFESEIARLEAMCSRREYCSLDILDKLKRRGVEGADAAKILQVLTDEKYLDDSRYASAFARDKSSLAGWGAKKIAYQLTLKRIPCETIERALEEIDSRRAAIRLEDIIAVKLRGLRKEEDLQKKRIKVIKYAMGRGYGYEEILAVLQNKLNNNDNI